MFNAFILTREWKDAPKGVRLELWVASDIGPVKVLIDKQEAVFFIAADDLADAQEILGVTWRYAPVDLRSWDNQTLYACYNRSQRRLRDGLRQLTSRGLQVWEGDIRPPERFLMERFIFAGISFDKAPDASENGFPVLQQVRCKASDYKPELKAVSIDIETSFDARTLYSIAAVGDCSPVVFMVRPPASTDEEKPNDEKEESAGAKVTDTELIDSEMTDAQSIETETGAAKLHWFDHQAECLQAFFDWLAEQDPDILMGWNVVQFDLWVLEQMCRRWGVKYSIGRERQEPSWRQANQGGHQFITVPGRVVLDGIELLKAAFYNFESFALGAVASELLGKEKLIQSENRAEEITRQYQEEPIELAKYNVQDCELVWDIFSKTQLVDFALARSQLTGLSADKSGGSVAAFEYAYLPLLHRAGFAAPNLGELQSSVVSPGGYVMDSKPGLYEHVLVLDFKSLYPSIIRSFNIDPCAYWQAKHLSLPDSECVPGFNEARFSRQHSLLPNIIAELWQAREVAKSEDNQPLSQAIKIIMNSFYGVLGSPGCRFFDPRVCSSITLRGHEILIATKHWIEKSGHRVIYGDTDSVFVHLPDVSSDEEANNIGQELAEKLNRFWTDRLQQDHQIDSFLEIEFETHFSRFFMPTIRGSELGSKKRYAGMVKRDGREEMVFKGLENVRTDWTMLARNFQEELYRRVFLEKPYRDYVETRVKSVLAGELDSELVYRKRLRQELSDYRHNIPPHAQAAAKRLQRDGHVYKQGDWVSYVLTVNGPEPLEWLEQSCGSPLDYSLYVERQLKPVADAILSMAGDSFDDIAASQMSLFH